jgi:hypothetical protein
VERIPSSGVLRFYIHGGFYGLCGKAFVPEAIAPTRLVVDFDFQVTGEDGLALAMLESFSVPRSVGGNLNLLGAKGWAVEFDTFRSTNDGISDPPSPHAAVVLNGPSEHLAFATGVPFNDGSWRHCTIRASSAGVNVVVDGTVLLSNVPVPWSVEQRYIGFTASTGYYRSSGLTCVDNVLVRAYPSPTAADMIWQLYP